jgi:hypothetical protein
MSGQGSVLSRLLLGNAVVILLLATPGSSNAVRIVVGSVEGTQGEVVDVPVLLAPQGSSVIFVFVDIGFSNLAGIVVPQVSGNSRPDCQAHVSSFEQLFAFRALGCDLQRDCEILRTILGLARPELPDGTVLYSCKFRIKPDAALGRYDLPCLHGETGFGIQPLPTTCEDGAIEVVGAPICPGDCDGNGEVTIDEILLGVTIAMGTASLDLCPAMDSDGDGEVTIDDLMRAVAAALEGCRVPEEQAQQFP